MQSGPGESGQLQNIEQMNEGTSRGGQVTISPPQGLSVERQFVEGGQYSVAIQWKEPRSLLKGVTGYAVYVNGEFNYDVRGSDQTSVLLTGIPRKQVKGYLSLEYLC